MRFSRFCIAVSSVALLVAACTNDYDEFEFVDEPGSGGSSGASGSSGSSGTGGASGCTGLQIECSGTCVDPTQDEQNCGACGTICGSTFVCENSLCGCATADNCGDGTMNPECTGDGRCRCDGQDCEPGERCRKDGSDIGCSCNGGGSCSGDEVCCAAGCKNIASDSQNCGACGKVCPTGQQCQDGSCA